MEDENKQIFLIDIGTRNCKAGLCGDSKPNIIIPTCLGKIGQFYTTEDVEYDPTIEEIINPIEHGVIKDFDCFNIIISKIFKMLGIEPEDQNLILTEPSLNSISSRRDLFGYMFEAFKIKNLFIANQALLSLYSTGKLTGIVVESGAGVTQIAPIFNTRVSTYAVNRIDFGGNELSEYLNRLLLSEKNFQFDKKKYLKILEQIKKEACYVENKYKKHLDKVEPYEFKLPDGNSIIIKNERTTVPEAIFRPDLLGKDWDGIHDLFLNSIEKIKEEDQKLFYENIIVSGGNTMFPGFEKKLEKKIKKKFGNNKNARFIHVDDKMNAAWIGGSTFSYSLNLDKDFVSKSEYEELGFNNCIKKIDSIQ